MKSMASCTCLENSGPRWFYCIQMDKWPLVKCTCMPNILIPPISQFEAAILSKDDLEICCHLGDTYTFIQVDLLLFLFGDLIFLNDALECKAVSLDAIVVATL